VIIITGPTSSGKTSLGLKLAKKFGAEIVSADSRQIYRYMDIGTGKVPIDATLDGVKIHMYDVVNPNQEYSSFQYAAKAREVIKNIKLPIIVGGTGFYIDALTTDKIETKVVPDNKIRDELSKKSLEELTEMIPADYLSGWNNSEKNNPPRLIRVIQIHQQTGAWPYKLNKIVDPSDNDLVIELTAPREFLYERVDKWAESIWELLIKETEHLIKMGFENTEPMNGIIYKTAKQFLNREISEGKALDLIKFDLHKYIRRQQTWFKKYKSSIKVDITEENFDTKVFSLVESYLRHER
jgi:tRNA dimethylallyltransferase